MRILLLLVLSASALRPWRVRPQRIGRLGGTLRPAKLALRNDLPSTTNCTWQNFEQRIDHFGKKEETFPQRLCLFDDWWRPAHYNFRASRSAPGPIFFYTGNESPVDVYVNNTGLMWELAKKFGARLVFAEHRCEPSSSLPWCGAGSQNCVGYCTTAQALADYAAIIKSLNVGRAPVVAFGGSYGGMLAGWMRMKMPEVVDGAIAASAPIWQLSTTVMRDTLDWPFQAVSRGVSTFGGSPQQCFENLRVAWPLIEAGLASPAGLQLLNEHVKSCEPLQSVKAFTTWVQSTYFLLAEGNYPFPSTYIPTAVGEGGTLPAWPMRVACEPLNQSFGITVTGSLEEVNYTVSMGDLKVVVDWEKASAVELEVKQLRSTGLLQLVEALVQSVAVWYNVSGTRSCWDIPSSVADVPEDDHEEAEEVEGEAAESLLLELRHGQCPVCPPCATCPNCPVSRCAKSSQPCDFKGTVDKTFAWTSITCNDDLSQISASGLGHDFYWPPAPSGISRNYTVASVVGPHGLQPSSCGESLEAQGLLGAPSTTDLWSTWLTAYYGGRNITHHSNIVWSNGALDPWSGMGVYPVGGGPEGPMVQKLNDDGSQIALVLDLGAHHLDLMFSDPLDPPCAAKARRVEERHIRHWCQTAYRQRHFEVSQI